MTRINADINYTDSASNVGILEDPIPLAACRFNFGDFMGRQAAKFVPEWRGIIG